MSRSIYLFSTTVQLHWRIDAFENYSISNLPNRTGYKQFILRANRSSLHIGSTFSKSGYTERYDDEGWEKILPKFIVGVRGMNLWRGVRKQPRNAKKVEFEAVSLADTNNPRKDIWYTSWCLSLDLLIMPLDLHRYNSFALFLAPSWEYILSEVKCIQLISTKDLYYNL